jgi:dCMP deaminase
MRILMSRWDDYFLGVCNAVASNSPCYSRQIGAILVRDKSIVATGYNGPPRGVTHCGKERLKLDHPLRSRLYGTIEPTPEVADTCPRQLMGLKSGEGPVWCTAAHAEQNTIANAARMGVAAANSTLYMNDQIPCKVCMAMLINAGIKEIVVTRLEHYDTTGKYLVDQAGIRIRVFR